MYSPLKTDTKPYKGVCCARCYVAKSDKKKCKCKCHGAHHGQGYRGYRDEGNPREKVLPESEAKRFRDQFTKTTCICGAEIGDEPILYDPTPRDDGWKISLQPENVWLYIKCPKCGHDMSLWKLGALQD